MISHLLIKIFVSESMRDAIWMLSALQLLTSRSTFVLMHRADPDPEGMPKSEAPRTKSRRESAAGFRPITTVNSTGGQSSRSKIKDYHFNTRVSSDTPPEERPRPGTLPGLFVRGWIPRADFYDDYEPPANRS